MVSDHSNRIYGQWCDNRKTVKYSPDDPTTTQDDADLMNGLWRRDAIRMGGQSAIDNGVFEAINCGFGAFMFSEEYEDEYDAQNMRQNICLKELSEAYRTVFFDSSAKLADKSDARHVTYLESFHKDELAIEYPEKTITNMDKLGDYDNMDWNQSDLIYVATRYHLEIKSTLVNAYSTEDSDEVIYLEGDEIKESEDEMISRGYVLLTSRRIKRRKVYKTVFCGNEELEPTKEINGDFLPIIPIYAYRTFVDGKENYYGVVRKKIDPQRLLNMVYSLAAEATAYSGQRKPIFTPEQMSSLRARESWSKSAHTKAYRLVDPVKDHNGNMQAFVPAWDEGGGLSPSATQLIQMTGNHLIQGTGGAAQDTLDPDASGKAINAVIKRTDQNTIIVFDNIEKSIKHGGVVYASKARKVYGSKENEGRHMQLVDDKDEIRSVQLLSIKPSIRGIFTANDPSKGKYQVIVGVSKGYDTESEETITALKDIASTLPDGHELREMSIGKIIQLLPNSDLDDMKWFLRKRELANGAEPKSDKDKQFIEMLQKQNSQPKAPDMNDVLLENMAIEQRSKAEMNVAEIKQKEVENAKMMAEIQNKNADTLVKLKEAGQRLKKGELGN